MSLIPIVLGLIIAVPLGAFIQRTTALRRITTLTASIIFTIPSLALFVVLPLIIPTRILDEANVIVALTLYTVALLVRAVPEALDAVSPAVLDAATAVGYKPLVRMLKVELPLAVPVLIASLRVVAVTNISMVSVGSVIGIGGLGTWFTEGYQANKSDQIGRNHRDLRSCRCHRHIDHVGRKGADAVDTCVAGRALAQGEGGDGMSPMTS